MEARKVATNRGWQWVGEGFNLYKMNPGIWILMILIYLAGLLVLSMIPVVGSPLASLLQPVLIAGLMLGCRDLLLGRKLTTAYLFAAFGEHAPQLVAIGGINFICQSVISWLAYNVASDQLKGILSGRVTVDSAVVFLQALNDSRLSIAIAVVLFSVLWMALQFAPALVLFNRISAIQSLKASYHACMLNIVPLSLYGIVLVGLFFVSVFVPIVGPILVFPLVYTTVYMAYTDIFPPQLQNAEPQAGSPTG